MKVTVNTDDLCVECADQIIDKLDVPAVGAEAALNAKRAKQKERYWNNIEESRTASRERSQRHYQKHRESILQRRRLQRVERHSAGAVVD